MFGNLIRFWAQTTQKLGWTRAATATVLACACGAASANPSAQDLALAEKRLVEILAQIERQEINAAFRAVSDLTAEVPEFRAAQLLYADLLRLRMGGTPQGEQLANAQLVPRRNNQSVADQSIAPSEFYKGLQSELQRRRMAVVDLPPPGMVPSNFLHLSANVRHAIAVDTSKSRLYVFIHGPQGLELVSDFYVTVGRNGVHKRVEGDQRTPLGVYFVGRQIPGEKLPELYGKGALTVNYPNDWDRSLGRTGSGIWLHGVPYDQFARVPQASDGCVVLSNPDIAFLMDSIDVRTPVLITEKLEWVTPQWSNQNHGHDQFVQQLNRWKAAWAKGDTASLSKLYTPELATADALAQRGKRMRNLAAPLASMTLDDASIYHWREEAGEIRIVNLHVPSKKSKSTTVRQYWRMDAGSWHIFAEDVLN